MKSKTILTGLFLFTTIAMVACSSNKTNSTTSKTKPTEKVVKKNAVDEFIKEHKELIELNRENYYYNGQGTMYNKAKSKATEKNEQIFLSNQDLDQKLDKVKVTIGDYDNATKRLSITLKNNYSEDLIGLDTSSAENSMDNEVSATRFYISGYFLEETGIKEDYFLFNFSLKEDLPAGEEVTVKLLMPYFATEEYRNKSESTDYSNTALDSVYHLYEPQNLVYENNDQFLNGKSAMANYDNLFSTVRMTFKDNKYPKEAYISDKEVVEFYNLMKK